MSLSLLGNCEFEDSIIPLKGKTEWGVDTLTREVKGARELAADYIATLEQGQEFEGYFLQTFEPDEDPIVATIRLNYKGFLTGGTPDPHVVTQVVPAAGTISAVYNDENDGKGRIYKKIPLYNLQYGRPEAGIVFDEVVATRDIYTTGATKEFTFDAVQTVYKYITNGRPNAPRYYNVNIPRVPVIKRSRLTTADGSVYGKNAPSVFADLLPSILSRVISFTSSPVIGTPYFECEDVVRRELGEGESDTEGTYGG